MNNIIICLIVLLSIGIPDSIYSHPVDTIKSDQDIIWFLFASFLVFIMQAGFMCLEAGMARAKSSINVAVKNLIDFLLCGIFFWVAGFGLMFGDSYCGLIVTNLFLISEENKWLMTFFVFQLMFAGTSATIISGAVAERIKFTAYITCTIITSTIIYPVFGHWAWGGLYTGSKGWLESLGFTDFAGSTVVHSIGGWIALIAISILGPRWDKFSKDGIPKKIFPYNLRLVYLGVFFLFFGWFGFNGGSTLKVDGHIAIIIVNTILGACFGGIAATIVARINSNDKVFEAEYLANGVIGGLVAITAGCAFVPTLYVPIIVIVAGTLVYYGTVFIEEKLKLDDVVGAISAHAFCGVWGTIATGIFMDTGSLESLGNSRIEQLMIQMLGAVTALVWSCAIALPVFLILKKTNMYACLWIMNRWA
ncbi:MAG: ammonium transporter [Spirochaetota bacterium]|nr:ammonium transporter [Spirochaetota bacterium]